MAEAQRDAVLVLCGQTGWGLAETERALARARHGDRIVRVGYLPDMAVPALLRQATVVAYPAVEEGFGLPALEALACGAPLITTEGTAMAEMAAGRGLTWSAPAMTRRWPMPWGSALEQGKAAPEVLATAGRSVWRWPPASPGPPAWRRHVEAFQVALGASQ